MGHLRLWPGVAAGFLPVTSINAGAAGWLTGGGNFFAGPNPVCGGQDTDERRRCLLLKLCWPGAVLFKACPSNVNQLCILAYLQST